MQYNRVELSIMLCLLVSGLLMLVLGVICGRACVIWMHGGVPYRSWLWSLDNTCVGPKNYCCRASSDGLIGLVILPFFFFFFSSLEACNSIYAWLFLVFGVEGDQESGIWWFICQYNNIMAPSKTTRRRHCILAVDRWSFDIRQGAGWPLSVYLHYTCNSLR